LSPKTEMEQSFARFEIPDFDSRRDGRQK
jgi:hypothetical protein